MWNKLCSEIDNFLYLILICFLVVSSSIEELDYQISQLMRKVPNEHNILVWECCSCGQTSAKGIDIKRHIEARHVSFPGFNCNNCGKLYKTRNSLRNHNCVVWLSNVNKSDYIAQRWVWFTVFQLLDLQLLRTLLKSWTLRYLQWWGSLKLRQERIGSVLPVVRPHDTPPTSSDMWRPNIWLFPASPVISATNFGKLGGGSTHITAPKMPDF